MKKRMLALFLALTMCLALTPEAALAVAGSFEMDGTVLAKYIGSGGAVDIPSGVTEIGGSAFTECTSVTSVTIPDSVINIGPSAFSGCTGLTSVRLPDGVSIDGNAFSGCAGLTSLTIPSGVTYIAIAAFENCANLADVTILSSDTMYIGPGAFRGCANLTAFQVDSGNQSYTAADGVLFTKDEKTLLLYPAGKEGAYAVPDGVTVIGHSAFHSCAGLTGVTIPSGVTTIQPSAFEGCTGLTSMIIPDSVTSIGNGVFSGCTGLKDVYYAGTPAQWNTIEFDEPFDFRDDLTNAAVHYNSTGPDLPQRPDGPDPSGTAYASTQTVTVDGKAVEFQAYALKDDSGNDTNYVKLRDVASVLNGTAAQFSVGWDQAAKSITVTRGQAYDAGSAETETPFSGDRAYVVSASPLYIDGKPAELGAILLADDTGSGYTYFKLRDLGAALDFHVDWSAEQGISIETDRPSDAS